VTKTGKLDLVHHDLQHGKGNGDARLLLLLGLEPISAAGVLGQEPRHMRKFHI